MQSIKIKAGDTVIRRDGLKGKIIVIDEYDETCSVIQYENGQTSLSDLQNIDNFYLIGSTVIGNKVPESYITEQIVNCDQKIEEIKAAKKQLRKQLWRLNEEMVEDWRERKVVRLQRKENNKNESTEQPSEDCE